MPVQLQARHIVNESHFEVNLWLCHKIRRFFVISLFESKFNFKVEAGLYLINFPIEQYRGARIALVNTTMGMRLISEAILWLGLCRWNQC